jgi:hypothetical protein
LFDMIKTPVELESALEWPASMRRSPRVLPAGAFWRARDPTGLAIVLTLRKKCCSSGTNPRLRVSSYRIMSYRIMSYRIMTVTGSVIALHAGSEHSGNVPKTAKSPQASLARFRSPSPRLERMDKFPRHAILCLLIGDCP